jgi:epoxyqueuosine reductase
MVVDVRTVKSRIVNQARAMGFAAVGVARAEGAGEREGLERFLAEGRHGDMAWMRDVRDVRGKPEAIWPAAKSAIVVGVSYAPAGNPLASLADRSRAAIALYARRRDYHDVLKRRLKALAHWIADTFACEVKVFVDTAPVMEKPLAARAGIGWQGKHTNLVSREFGSWLLLGEVFTSLDLPPDALAEDICGSCDACVRACPTGALDAPYRIDARRCVSYLTIEHKGEIPPEFAHLTGNRVFGCDDCLAACPWNKFARACADPELAEREDLARFRLADLARLDDASFRALFAKTPIKRTGHARMMRNVRVALDNARKI